MTAQLTEPGMIYFIDETLKQCKKKKYVLYNGIMNIIIVVSLVLGVGVILYNCYKSKKNVNKEEKEIEKQEYILKKIKMFQVEKQRERNELITNLPIEKETHKDVNGNVRYL